MNAPSRIKIIRPQTREEWLAGRMATIGGSELPTLFGVNKHQTPYELFALKSGLITKAAPEIEIRENSIHVPPMGRGNIFEDDALDLVRMLRPTWTVEPNAIPGGCVYVDQQARMSSTPDARLFDPARPDKKGTLQIKSMAQMVFDKEWKEDGEVVPPMSAAIQAIDDATLSDCDFAYVGAFVANFNIDFYLIEVPLHPQLMVKARGLVADFWRRVAENDPYPPDFARDGEAIAAIYANDDGSEIDLSGNERVAELIPQREMLKEYEAKGAGAKNLCKPIDAELRTILGNAERGRLADGRLLEAKEVKNGGYTVEPFTYRPIKIKTPKAPKGKLISYAGAET